MNVRRAVLMLALLVACQNPDKVTDIEPFVTPPTIPADQLARLAVVAASEELGDLDVWIDGIKQAASIQGIGTFSFDVRAGEHLLQLTPPGGTLTAAVFDAPFGVEALRSVTLMLYVEDGEVQASPPVADEPAEVPVGQVNVRYVNTRPLEEGQGVAIGWTDDNLYEEGIPTLGSRDLLVEARPHAVWVVPEVDDDITDPRAYTVELQEVDGDALMFEIPDPSGALELVIVTEDGGLVRRPRVLTGRAQVVNAASLPEDVEVDADVTMNGETYSLAYGESTPSGEVPLVEDASLLFTLPSPVDGALNTGIAADPLRPEVLFLSSEPVDFNFQSPNLTRLYLDPWGVTPGSTRITVTSADETVTLIDLATAQPLATVQAGADPVDLEVPQGALELGILEAGTDHPIAAYTFDSATLQGQTNAGLSVHPLFRADRLVDHGAVLATPDGGVSAPTLTPYHVQRAVHLAEGVGPREVYANGFVVGGPIAYGEVSDFHPTFPVLASEVFMVSVPTGTVQQGVGNLSTESSDGVFVVYGEGPGDVLMLRTTPNDPLTGTEAEFGVTSLTSPVTLYRRVAGAPGWTFVGGPISGLSTILTDWDAADPLEVGLDLDQDGAPDAVYGPIPLVAQGTTRAVYTTEGLYVFNAGQPHEVLEPL